MDPDPDLKDVLKLEQERIARMRKDSTEVSEKDLRGVMWRQIQNDFDKDTKDIKEERRAIAEKKILELRENVRQLKTRYYAENKLRSECQEKERGIFARLKSFFFVPKERSTSERLDRILLDTRVRESLSAYREAKSELEEAESLLAKSKE